MYMPVCRECYVFKTKQMEDRKQAAQNDVNLIKFNEDEDNTLISITKSAASKNTADSSPSEMQQTEHENAKSPAEFKQ